MCNSRRDIFEFGMGTIQFSLYMDVIHDYIVVVDNATIRVVPNIIVVIVVYITISTETESVHVQLLLNDGIVIIVIIVRVVIIPNRS